MMDIDKLIDNAEAYGEGMKQGKEMAIKNYDKLFLELYQKMQDIENKLDSFIYGLEKFTKKKVSISTKEVINIPQLGKPKVDNGGTAHLPNVKEGDIHSQNKELLDKDYGRKE